MLMFMVNIWKSKRDASHLPPPGPDPWDARSLEWMVPSPTPVHNFDTVPVVRTRDEWWHRKYTEAESGEVMRVATIEEAAQAGDAEGVHLPSPSFWPLAVAVGLPLVGYGIIFNLWLALVGGVVTLASLYSWAMEPVDDADADHGHSGHGDHDGDGEDGRSDDDASGDGGSRGGGADSDRSDEEDGRAQ